MGISATYPAGQNILTLMEAPGGHLDFAQNKLHLRNLAGHYVLDVADFAKETPRRPPQEKMACMMPPRKETNTGQLAPPGGDIKHFFAVYFLRLQVAP